MYTLTEICSVHPVSFAVAIRPHGGFLSGGHLTWCVSTPSRSGTLSGLADDFLPLGPYPNSPLEAWPLMSHEAHSVSDAMHDIADATLRCAGQTHTVPEP